MKTIEANVIPISTPVDREFEDEDEVGDTLVEESAGNILELDEYEFDEPVDELELDE
jgi:hypothetical protein